MHKRKNLHKLALAATAGLICLSASSLSYADDTFYPDMTQKGSIFVEMRSEETNQHIEGGTITMYKTGDYVHIDNTHLYKATINFEGFSCYLDLTDPDLAGELAEYAKENEDEGWSKTIDSYGRVGFLELDTGLYLLVQREAPEGYHCVSPFLVTVPLYDEANGTYLFDIDATPKTAPLKKDDTAESEEHKTDDSGQDDQGPDGPSTPSDAGSEKASPSDSKNKGRSSKSSGGSAPGGPGVTEIAEEAVEADEPVDTMSLSQTGEGRNSIIGSIIFAASGILLAITAGLRLKMRS